MQTRTYLDANASAPLLPEAREAMAAALGVGNASSVHAEGRRARQLIEAARAEVARTVGARLENVVFTSGATEAAALALTPRLRLGKGAIRLGRLYVGATEHPCVLVGGRFSQSAVTRVPVCRTGVLDLAALEQALDEHDNDQGPPYVALMLANNETGVIHPVAEAALLTHAHGGYVFCDAVQAIGRIPVEIGALGVDFLSVSAHKIGGPQGAGALILADERLSPEPLLSGGGQERRHRAGTENVAAIAGFGVAARLAQHHLGMVSRTTELRDRVERQIVSVVPEARIIGADAPRLGNTSLFAVPGLDAETLVIAFDLEGIAVSAGSACSSGKVTSSHVLEAMGVPGSVARSGLRVSIPNSALDEDVEAFTSAWRAIYSRMSQSRAA
jgi:cysteine desulfurase